MDSPAPPRWKTVLILTLGILAIATAPILIRVAMDSLDTVPLDTVPLDPLLTPPIAPPAPGGNPATPTPTKAALGLMLAASRLVLASAILSPNWRDFQAQQYPRQGLIYGLAAGICLAVHFATWISSLAYTSIAASTILVTTSPIWVALLSRLWLGERLGALTWGGIALALGGGVWVALADAPAAVAPQPLLGNALALMGSWSISLYLILGRLAQRQGLQVRHYTTGVYTIAALGLLPLPWLWGSGYGGYPTPVYVCLGLMTLFPQLVGHSSLNWAVRWVSPTLVTLAILGEPLGASLLGYWVFGEVPPLAVLAGSGLILGGIGVATWDQRSPRSP
ncbi:DMT family transporter [Prochlorothrix hollandica]|uniref:Membrane protein n=1 Tax=Prochlorothrix hollandica PCC 9006 = CALU 1027 TaxID=317619 RepID=A0A0M2PVU3_PROHO|nr:DMT family transporter [Prochlorothrix hollandica]KKI98486.1 membrane protein [Prochlorothrix hollandica PCC 9006 = CALU 1027]